MITIDRGRRRAGIAAALAIFSASFGEAQQMGQLAPSSPSTASRPAMQSTPTPAPRSNSSSEPWILPAPSTQLAPRASLMTQPPPSSMPSAAQMLDQIPDPIDAPRIWDDRLRSLPSKTTEPRVLNNYRRTVDEAKRLLMQATRDKKIDLGLAECVQRAIMHNYSIRSQSYNPAIADTVIVSAEAAFDASFFLDVSDSANDQPVPSQLASGQSEVTSYGGGFRKLLATGMQAQIGLRQQRTFTDSQFQTINPAWESVFFAELRQPLLRGFGLDYNRSQIEIAKTDRRIAGERFEQQVRDTVLDVESAYWQLVRIRRTVAIQALSVAQNYVTYQSIYDRKEHDASAVQLANAEARWRSRYVVYLESIRLMRDAEDRLKNLLNDPAIKLSDAFDLVPTEHPYVSPLVLDQFAEVRTALENRSEIKQARLAIDRDRVQTNRAKNETLPQLDATFNYQVTGLEGTADNSFDRLTTDRFRSYTVSVAFSYPLGNRAAVASLRRARLTESQAIVDLNRVTDGVVEEVNGAVRTLNVRWEQIAPQHDAVLAAVRNLESLQARTLRIDPEYLETELSAVEQLADTRTRLATVLTDYNTALATLERAKGTLLRYNNISIADEPSRR
ncbi:MAG: TolC family protein [Phycisphaerae bacterium]